MNSAVHAQLQAIGSQVDAGTYPNVFNDGVIAPKDSVVNQLTTGAENYDEQQGTCRSAAGSWPGTAGWQGPSGRSRASGDTEPSGSRQLCENYLGQLDAVFAAYPRTAVWTSGDGMWLAVDSSVLAGLDRKATFLIAVPFRHLQPIRAWAFWTTAVSRSWIGPRHTNAIDGSICAFNPSEGTWKVGGDLVGLIDQFTMWAFCHLHLEVLGCWPGRQTAEFIYERLTELKDNEWCGCRPDAERYADCCKQSDLAADRFQAAMQFVGGFLKFKPRQPPVCVSRLIWEGGEPPAFQRARPDPMLFLGSCLFPVKAGAKLSDAAKWAMPKLGRRTDR